VLLQAGEAEGLVAELAVQQVGLLMPAQVLVVYVILQQPDLPAVRALGGLQTGHGGVHREGGHRKSQTESEASCLVSSHQEKEDCTFRLCEYIYPQLHLFPATFSAGLRTIFKN
jgi:hypothetical protein